MFPLRSRIWVLVAALHITGCAGALRATVAPVADTAGHVSLRTRAAVAGGFQLEEDRSSIVLVVEGEAGMEVDRLLPVVAVAEGIDYLAHASGAPSWRAGFRVRGSFVFVDPERQPETTTLALTGEVVLAIASEAMWDDHISVELRIGAGFLETNPGAAEPIGTLSLGLVYDLAGFASSYDILP